MSPSPDPGALLSELRAALARTAFYEWTGIALDEAEPGRVTASLRLDERHLNVQGLVHGGIVATLADVAMGLSVRTAVGPGRQHVTVDMGVHYLRPAPAGRVRSSGRAIRVGSQIAYAEADVIDEQDRLLARATGTYLVGERADSPVGSHAEGA